QEHDVELPSFPGCNHTLEPSQRILAVHSIILRLQQFKIAADGPGNHSGAVNEGDMACPPGQRLHSAGTATGEQVEAVRVHDGVLQPVEQCLANAIGRRTQALRIGKVETAAAPLPGYDTEAVASAGSGSGHALLQD